MFLWMCPTQMFCFSRNQQLTLQKKKKDVDEDVA